MTSHVKFFCGVVSNLVPRVLRLFGQWMGARKDSGELEFNLNFLIGCPVTVCIVFPQKSCGNKLPVPRVSPGAHPLTKKPEDSGYEIALSPGPYVKNIYVIFKIVPRLQTR